MTSIFDLLVSVLSGVQAGLLRNKLATATSTKIDRLTSIVQGRLSPYPTLVCVEFLTCPEGQMLHRIWNIEAAVELL
jgi:hypothetical protein